MRLDLHHHHHVLIESRLDREILSAITRLKGALMSTQADHAAALKAVAEQVDKIGSETRALLGKVDELTTALNNAGQTTPEVDAALAALQAQVAVVDDLVPDAPPQQP
jgi:uncharacterized protein YoxC